MGVVEVILIIVVLIGLVIIFQTQIKKVVDSIFKTITSKTGQSQMIRDEQGSTSAFLAMLFLVFLLLISVCVEGIYMYTARGKAMGIYMSGLSHTKGNYQKELADMYHIYAMDPRYHKRFETDFSDPHERKSGSEMEILFAFKQEVRKI